MYYTYTDMMKGLFTKQMDVTNMQLFWQVRTCDFGLECASDHNQVFLVCGRRPVGRNLLGDLVQ